MPKLRALKFVNRVSLFNTLRVALLLVLLPVLLLLQVGCDSQERAVNQQPQLAFEPVSVDNFMLLDHMGVAHELYYYDDAAAIVIMIHGNGCPIVRNSLSDYQTLDKQYKSKNVRFFLLNSNLQDDRASIAEEAQEWSIELPILDDDDQLVGESLALTRTAEVLVIDPSSRQLIYRGPLNDRVSYELQKDAAQNHYLQNALNAHLANNPVPAAPHPAKGCLINFSDSASAEDISYVDDVAPILIDGCIDCHREGGIAPWSMSSYAMVQGFAPMIREVIRVKRMPPWHADPAVGYWREDRSLSIADRRTLVHWIEAGAPRGEGEDPLVKIPPADDGWLLGEPDLVLNVPAFGVPANGVVEYQFPSIDNPMDKDVWVNAVLVKPGNVKVLHHMFVGFSNGNRPDAAVTDNFLGAWSPGAKLKRMDDGTAVLLPKDAKITFEMHYTPYGKATIDRTQVALYFADEPPKKILRYSEVLNHHLLIPAGARNYLDQAYFEFERDAHIYKLVPHSHYRGKSSQFFLQYPSGQKTLLLSVPNYDFNWQTTYSYTEPLAVPAGSRLIYQTTFDNSEHNDNNPDPGRPVSWGLQSADEMLFGPFIFSWDDESPANITHSYRRTMYARKMGFLDRNFDGLLETVEIPREERREFYPIFGRGDKNGDGALTHAELMSAVE